jgi:hypothetical protein
MNDSTKAGKQCKNWILITTIIAFVPTMLLSFDCPGICVQAERIIKPSLGVCDDEGLDARCNA